MNGSFASLRMMRIFSAALLAAAALAGCVARDELITERILADAQRRRELSFLPTPTTTPAPTPPSVTPTATRTPLPGRSYAHVRRVLDGNTILIDGGLSVRYIGVDTPGAGMFGRPLDPFGREAAERNVELTEGRQVELEADDVDVTSDGILLRYVYVDDLMVNELLLREGLAWLDSTGRNTRYTAQLRTAEAVARNEPLNVWTLISPTPTITQTPTETLTPTITPTPTVTSTPTLTRVPAAPGGIFVPVASPPTPTRPPTPRPAVQQPPR